MKVRKAVTGLGVMGVALVVASPLLAQGQPQAKAMPAAACTVALTPEALKVQADPFQVKAVLSQAIGAVAAAKIQEENSGIDIALGAAPAPGAAAPAQPPAAAPAGARPPAAGPSSAAQPAPVAAAAAAPAPAADAASPGQALDLLFSTATARPGNWTLTLEGANGTCSGKVHVDAAGPN